MLWCDVMDWIGCDMMCGGCDMMVDWIGLDESSPQPGALTADAMRKAQKVNQILESMITHHETLWAGLSSLCQPVSVWLRHVPGGGAGGGGGSASAAASPRAPALPPGMPRAPSNHYNDEHKGNCSATHRSLPITSPHTSSDGCCTPHHHHTCI